MEQKKAPTPNTTVTRSMKNIWEQTGNVYQSVDIIAKRANQIALADTQDFKHKAEEFGVSAEDPNKDSKKENPELVQLSRSFENKPKATLRATTEFENKDLFWEENRINDHNEEEQQEA